MLGYILSLSIRYMYKLFNVQGYVREALVGREDVVLWNMIRQYNLTHSLAYTIIYSWI